MEKAPRPANFSPTEEVDENILTEEVDENILPEEQDENILTEEVDENIFPEELDENILPEEQDENILPEEQDENILPEEQDENILTEEVDENILSEEVDENILTEEVDENILPEEVGENILPEEQGENILPEEEGENIITEEEGENILTEEQDENILIPPPEQKNLANSILLGDVNAPKTRVVILELAGPVSSEQVVLKERVTIVMSERKSDRMVEAFVQFQNSDSCPHDPVPIPTMPTADHADRYATQLCDLMEKDGYEVVKDDVMRHSDVQDYLVEHGFTKCFSSNPFDMLL